MNEVIILDENGNPVKVSHEITVSQNAKEETKQTSREEVRLHRLIEKLKMENEQLRKEIIELKKKLQEEPVVLCRRDVTPNQELKDLSAAEAIVLARTKNII